MNKKILFVVAALAVISIFTAFSPSFAAEAKKPAAETKKPAVVSAQPAAAKQPPRPAFAMVSGTLLKIDTADPANMKVTVKNEADGNTHVISVSPTTQITKLTDITELKTGDAVRVMARKAEDKEIAMGIIFGKLAARPAPKPVVRSAAPATQALTAVKGAKK